MKIFYKLTFCLTMLLFAAGQQGQSQVLIGDIAFTGYNSNGGSDDFTFMILKPGGLPASSVINFTDCGWGGNLAAACNSNSLFAANGTTETDIAWTSPAALLPYGTQVRIAGLTASSGTVTGTALSLSGIGDQILAFTGARTAPNFIAGIQMNIDAGATGNTWDNISVSSTTSSNRPACLIDGTYSIWLGPTESDNAAFKCNVLVPATQAAALALINSPANWDQQDATAYTLPRTCPLPVQLISFNAKNVFTGVDVQWQVTNQQNFSHYEVERSFDNKTFDKIGTVFAKPGTGIISYNFSDFESLKNNAAIIYYRLKSVDLDAKFSYSTIVSVRNKKGASLMVDNLTNPVKNNLGFTLASKNAGTVQIQLTDINGKILATRSLQVTAGSNTGISMPEAAALPQGMYLLKISNAGETTVTKFIK